MLKSNERLTDHILFVFLSVYLCIYAEFGLIPSAQISNKIQIKNEQSVQNKYEIKKEIKN